MSKVIVISGHPNLSESNTNQVVLNAVSEAFEQVEVRKLDELYPNFVIDVAAEQAALINADIIVLQFPFYWYSVPALLKKWIDDVFSYNFAYGQQGDKLKGKEFILSFTVGGPQESYTPLGYNHFSIEELVRPLEQTAYLAGLNFHKPIFSHGMVYIPGVYNELADVQNKAMDHANSLIDRINQLSKLDEAYVNRFIRNWFKAFDQMPNETAGFTQHLANDVVWEMPEGKFIGHAGFNDWYAGALKQFKPNCDHQIQALTVTETDAGFDAELTIKLTAETYEDSDFKGESISINAHEKWQLVIEGDSLLIKSYRVSVNE